MLIFDMLNRSINLLNVPKVIKLSNFKLYLQSHVQKAFRRALVSLKLICQIQHFSEKIQGFKAIFGDFHWSQRYLSFMNRQFNVLYIFV